MNRANREKNLNFFIVENLCAMEIIVILDFRFLIVFVLIFLFYYPMNLLPHQEQESLCFYIVL